MPALEIRNEEAVALNRRFWRICFNRPDDLDIRELHPQLLQGSLKLG